MKRLARLCFNLAVIASTILFAAIMAGWITSLFRNDMLLFSLRSGTTYLLAQSHGELLFSNSINPADAGTLTSSPAVHFSHMALPKDYRWQSIIWLFVIGDRQSDGAWKHGFGYVKQTDAIPGEQVGWAMLWPYWSILLFTVLLPLAKLWRWRPFRVR